MSLKENLFDLYMYHACISIISGTLNNLNVSYLDFISILFEILVLW